MRPLTIALLAAAGMGVTMAPLAVVPLPDPAQARQTEPSLSEESRRRLAAAESKRERRRQVRLARSRAATHDVVILLAIGPYVAPLRDAECPSLSLYDTAERVIALCIEAGFGLERVAREPERACRLAGSIWSSARRVLPEGL